MFFKEDNGQWRFHLGLYRKFALALWREQGEWPARHVRGAADEERESTRKLAAQLVLLALERPGMRLLFPLPRID